MSGRFLGKYDGRKGAWLKAGKRFALLVAAIFILFRFVLGVGWVSGVSMQPTYRDGTMVVHFRLAKSYRVGDVASVKMPSGEYYIKRVVAVAGDTVELIDGRVYVNGVAETGAYVNGETLPQGEGVSYPLTVPNGRIFVLGDNRVDSVDSRSFGAVAISQTRGKILFSIG